MKVVTLYSITEILKRVELQCFHQKKTNQQTKQKTKTINVSGHGVVYMLTR